MAQKNLREIIKAKVIKNGIDNCLHHTDLLGILKRFGKERSLGGEIYKSLIYMDTIFGLDYVIKTSIRLAGDPKSYELLFPKELGKIYAIKYFRKLFEGIHDKKDIEAIKEYKTNCDLKVSNFAKRHWLTLNNRFLILQSFKPLDSKPLLTQILLINYENLFYPR